MNKPLQLQRAAVDLSDGEWTELDDAPSFDVDVPAPEERTWRRFGVRWRPADGPQTATAPLTVDRPAEADPDDADH